MRAVAWRRRKSRGQIEFDWNDKPHGDVATLAEEACNDLLSDAMINHSYRTWVFGQALAEIDRVQLDDELFFAAAMLHDLGLGCPTFKECFTLAGADKLNEIGKSVHADLDEVAKAADGITHHITPALKVSEGGPIGYYLQGGSALDLGGLRAIHLPRDFTYEMSENVWPMLTIKREGGARWRAESAMVKHGRAHVLQRWTRFGSVSRTTPLPPQRPRRRCAGASGAAVSQVSAR